MHGDFPSTSSSYHLIVATREARVAASHSPNAVSPRLLSVSQSSTAPPTLRSNLESEALGSFFFFFNQRHSREFECREANKF